MTRKSSDAIEVLIERSSLGSKDARRARSRVSAEAGAALARSAMTGTYVRRAEKPRPAK